MLRYLNIGVLTVALFFFLLSTPSFGLEGSTTAGRDDSAFRHRDADISNYNGNLYSYFPLTILQNIYRAISRVDGDRCPMHPTCSRYSIEAIQKHGFCIGIVMTCDRLIHEANEMDYAPLVEVGTTVKYSDPVENNDFWWSD